MTSHEVEHARHLLVTGRARIERGWCQHKYAVTAGEFPEPVYSNDERAVQWCMLGAIGDDLNSRYANSGLYMARTAMGVCIFARYPSFAGQEISAFNDHPYRTKEQVLEIFDCAVKHLTKEVAGE